MKKTTTTTVKTEAPKELLDAEDRCPEVKFVKSCREFFERRGFLSEAQRNALTFSGTRNRRYRQFYKHAGRHK